MKGIKCVECENLFYIDKRICLPISDLDCIESDGINNKCLKSKLVGYDHFVALYLDF